MCTYIYIGRRIYDYDARNITRRNYIIYTPLILLFTSNEPASQSIKSSETNIFQWRSHRRAHTYTWQVCLLLPTININSILISRTISKRQKNQTKAKKKGTRSAHRARKVNKRHHHINKRHHHTMPSSKHVPPNQCRTISTQNILNNFHLTPGGGRGAGGGVEGRPKKQQN